MRGHALMLARLKDDVPSVTMPTQFVVLIPTSCSSAPSARIPFEGNARHWLPYPCVSVLQPKFFPPLHHPDPMTSFWNGEVGNPVYLHCKARREYTDSRLHTLIKIPRIWIGGSEKHYPNNYCKTGNLTTVCISIQWHHRLMSFFLLSLP